MTDLKELRRLAEAATPGPWAISEGEIVARAGDIVGVVYRTEAWTTGDLVENEDQTNAAYIAAANPAAILELLDRLAELEADLMRHKKAIASMAFGSVPDDIPETRRLTPFPGEPAVVVMSPPSRSDDGGFGR